MQFINLTPHVLNVHTGEIVRSIPPSGVVARVSETFIEKEAIGNIPVRMATVGSILDLPAPEEGKIFIASKFVAAAAEREDVLSPGPLLRDDKGRPIGCDGLQQHGYG